MKIYLVRHTIAIEPSADVIDERRYLTPEGRVFFRKTARTMLKSGVEPSLILTSPMLRAVQTADILAEALDFAGPLIAVDELSHGFDLASLRKLLDDFHSADELVLVGHEPDLSSLLASLLSLNDALDFKKGTAVKLKINPSDPQASAAFKWLASGRKLITSMDKALSL